jgi:serine/threonine-protein kinase
MAAPASPQVIGRYAVYGKIASGGMASVCFGRLLGGEGFARTVAIKRLHPHLAQDPEFRATLIDEAHMAARIHHPNVVPTLDVVTADDELLLVMEYVRGESLSRLLKVERDRQRLVPLPIVSAVASGALYGLHAAHEATSDRGIALGIVHRDVSPQNLLVGVDGLARVIDFGVAKAAGRVQTTRDGAIKGKIAYMAPEQVSGHDVSRAADVYAMGVVLWEMLAGARLFQGESDVALLAKVMRGADDPPSFHAPNLPAGLDELVMRALAADPADRFASAHDMATRLVKLVPPAQAVEVGKWVEEAARRSLSQRGAELAEIESSSGVGMIPPPVSARIIVDDVASRSRRGALHETGSRRGITRDPRLEASASGGHPRSASTSGPQAAIAEGEVSNVASQPSNSSSHSNSNSSLGTLGMLGTLGPRAEAQPRTWRGSWTVALGVAALLGLGLAALVRIATTPPTPPAMASTSARTEPTVPPQAAPPLATALPPGTGVPSPAPVAAAPPPVPVTALPPAAPAAAPGPRPLPRPPRAPAPAPPAPAAEAPGAGSTPRSKAACNPPYVIDSAGDRQYKPECL